MFEKYVGISEEKLAYELYMTPEQITTLKRHGMFIGVHGYDHYWLGKLPTDEMKNDIDLALKSMDMFIDRNSWVMNYPFGSYNEDVLEYVSKKGAVIGVSTTVRSAEIGIDNNLCLPRFDCNDFPPISIHYQTI